MYVIKNICTQKKQIFAHKITLHEYTDSFEWSSVEKDAV